MKLALAALLLLSACAAKNEPDPASTWRTSQIGQSYMNCDAGGWSRLQCDCLVREYERASPDPDADSTREEIAAAFKACGIPLPPASTGVNGHRPTDEGEAI